MGEGRYNIPKQYKVEKGMPIDALAPRIKNDKCREIFQTEVASVEWLYHITDGEYAPDLISLLRQKGISVFEVIMRHKVSTELLTEMFAGLLQKRCVLVYMCDDELAMGTYIPSGKPGMGRMCSTDFYPFDVSRMIEILDFAQDCDKSVEEIHCRILNMLRQQKRMIMIEKAFESLQENKPKPTEIATFDFSEANLNRIRHDTEFVQAQLMA